MIQFDSQFADGLETTNYFLTKSLVVEMLKIIDNLGILECIKLRSTISSSGHGWNTVNSFNDKSKALSSPVPLNCSQLIRFGGRQYSFGYAMGLRTPSR